MEIIDKSKAKTKTKGQKTQIKTKKTFHLNFRIVPLSSATVNIGSSNLFGAKIGKKLHVSAVENISQKTNKFM
jgi:hypothetical protein